MSTMDMPLGNEELLRPQEEDTHFQPENTAEMEFLKLRDRIHNRLFSCLTHKFSFPISMREHKGKPIQYPTINGVKYDAHQSCTDCATERLWDTKTWTHGPMFKFK